MKRIETHHARAPWTWVFPMALFWLPQAYAEWCSAAPMTFTIRKFTEDPTTIAFLSSVNLAFNFMVGAITSYMSDRIWTRWGRRRPFLILGWLGVSVAMFLVPLAPNIWTVALAIIFYQFCMDFAKPYEPLFNEVIPPMQRGRAAVIRNILLNISALFFNGVMIAQFDRQYDLKAFGNMLHVNGELLLYGVGAALIFCAACFLILIVRETQPLKGVTIEKFNPRQFIMDVFINRQWWMLYLVYVCPSLIGGGVISFAALFCTDQLGFSKEEFGHIGMIALLVNMVAFVPLAGWLADKGHRITLLRIGLIMPGIINLVFFFYARVVADYSVSYGALLTFIILAGGTSGFISFAWVVLGPLLYDYIPSNRYGTVSAGFSFMQGLMSFIVINLLGFWVKGFTMLFGSGSETTFDYSSAYVFQLLMGILGFTIVTLFARQVKRGKIVRHAQIEYEEEKLRDQQAGGTA